MDMQEYLDSIASRHVFDDIIGFLFVGGAHYEGLLKETSHYNYQGGMKIESE
jgi:hypothetical protein